MTIAKSAFHGVSWSAASTLFKGAVQLTQLILLARILSPTELGVLAVVNLTLGFAQIFGDAGISNATIYHRDLTKAQLNQLYTVNVAFGGVISIVVILLSYSIEQFYVMSNLAELLILLSPVFFIRSLSQQHIALLQQKLKFDRLAKIEIVASTLGFVTLLILLNNNFQLQAVIISQLIIASTISCLMLLMSNLDSVSVGFPRLKDIWQPIRYGLYQTGEAFVNYFSSQFDQIIVGKLLGAESLGVYAYVKELVFRPALQLINPIASKVTFPLMVNYKDKHSIAAIYQQILSVLSVINIPLYIGMALYPATVLSLAYGESWQQHQELLRWLALYMLMIALINPVGSLLKATGNVKRGFWWNIGVTLVRPLIIIASVSSGEVWLVKMLLVSQMFIYLLHWRLLVFPVAKLAFFDMTKVFIPAFLAISGAFILISLINHFVYTLPSILELLAVAFVYCLFMFPVAKNILRSIRK